MFKNYIIKTIIASIAIIALQLINIELNASNDEETKTIYLYGENHANKEDEKFQNKIKALALDGKVVFLREAKLFSGKDNTNNNTDKYIYGVEDPLCITLTETIILNAYLRNLVNSKEGLEKLIFEIARDDFKIELLLALTQKLNQEFFEKFLEDRVELQKNYIFNYLKNNKNEIYKMYEGNSDLTVIRQTFQSKISDWTHGDDIWYWMEFTVVLAQMLSKEISISKPETLSYLLSCIENYQSEHDCANLRSILETAGLDLRNDAIINNIESIYFLTKEKGIPIICILGHKHIPEVKEGLEKKGFIVLNDKEVHEEL